MDINKIRRPKGTLSAITANYIHIRNPWTAVWWSAAFPGFGQFFLGKYINGLILMTWEVFLNINTNLNTAIVYSFTGKFDMAIKVLDKRWLLLYCGTYIYALWDSYRTCIDLNKLSILSERSQSDIITAKVNPIETNYLETKNPLHTALVSILMPGAGHLFTNRLITGFVILVWWIVFTWYSHILEAIHLTFTGNFQQAVNVTDPQFLLFMPSIYVFCIYDSYVNTAEYNSIFQTEQTRYLKRNYQDKQFILPVNREAR